jgi:hypothetical protein
MPHSWFRDPAIVGSAGTAVVLLGSVGAYLVLRKRPTVDEIEQRRREYLLEVGRILDGTVLDLADVDMPSPTGRGPALGPRKHIFYKYEVAGVGYECSQDVTMLPEQMAEATSTPGTPASVRYDPHNPTNSIVVAERWTGLRHSVGAAQPSAPADAAITASR